MTSELSPVEFADPFALPQADREMVLLAGLNALGAWHESRCSGYAQMLHGIYGARIRADKLTDIPYLPVRVFKHYNLKSVPDASVVRELTSSGTTGQMVSHIFLDAETSGMQVRALSSIVQGFLGRQRLPMLVIDQHETIAAKAALSARAAGIVGFSNFGRHHLYALDADMRPKWKEIESFIEAYSSQSILVFGFTYIVWCNFLQAAIAAGRRLKFKPTSFLIHGGGWKKLADRSVDNSTFKHMLTEQFGIERISNYYGMVEQVGSIFMECEAGFFHAPAFADVIMRDPITLESANSGVVEVLSLLPRSYPGHAILTEDIGTIFGVDDCACGRRGKYFHIHGRVPHAEMRGCSDVRVP